MQPENTIQFVMMNTKWIVPVLLLALLLGACSLPTAAPTVPATAAATAEPTGTPPAATFPPAPPSATAPVGGRPPDAIAILSPGPGSRVTSPVTVLGVADSTFEQSLTITILTADGAVLTDSFAQIDAELGQRGSFTGQAVFNIVEEQQGFIQVYAISPKDGGITHLSSVGVTLAPGGAANLVPSSEGPEQIQILQPAAGETISGGVVRVEGFGVASFEQTLLVEILDESGATLAFAPVMVAAPDLGQPGPFSAELPYFLPSGSSTAGRVVVRDVSPAHGGNSHLSSVEVTLQP